MKKAVQRLLISTAFCTLVLLNIQSMDESTKEIWKDVVGYEGLYQVSNLGFIKSLKRTTPKGNYHAYREVPEKIMELHDSNGYLRVHLSLNGKGKFLFIHRIVASHFVGNYTKIKRFTNHLDGNKYNNAASNLAIVSAAENKLHSYQVLGEKPRRGKSNGMFVYDSDVIEKVKYLRKAGKTYDEVFRITGVSRTHACRIVNNKSGLYV